MPLTIEDEGKIFHGPKDLLKLYLNITKDVSKIYMDGNSFCFAGLHGTGKSLTISNILKKACHKNFSCLYTTLSDIVSVLTTAPGEEKYFARKELLEVDFLACDEFDNRFFGSENAAELFGKTLESVLRARLQNKLPTFLASNSPNPLEGFNASIKTSLDSLMSKIQIVPVLGKDYRKVLGSGEQQ